MRTIFILIVLVAILYNATSLKCFYCAGSLSSDCYGGIKSSMAIQDCNALQRNISTAKLPISDYGPVDEKENNEIVTTCVSFIAYTYGMAYAERSCGYIYEGLDICEYLEGYYELVDCLHCDRDLCN